MPTEAQIEAWFPYLLAFNLCWIAGWITVGVLRRIQSGRPFFPRRPERAVFYESGASGGNLKTFLTRLGGASRCLVVSIADGRLQTDLTFPFNVFLFVNAYGTRIDVGLAEIRSIELRKRALLGEVVIVRWGDNEGFEFRVSEPLAMTRALDPQGRLLKRP